MIDLPTLVNTSYIQPNFTLYHKTAVSATVRKHWLVFQARNQQSNNAMQHWQFMFYVMNGFTISFFVSLIGQSHAGWRINCAPLRLFV
jgi:hypothetical protein